MKTIKVEGEKYNKFKLHLFFLMKTLCILLYAKKCDEKFLLLVNFEEI